MGEFVGKRVVPDHVGVWDQKKTYEPLMIVLDSETGDSYISRKAVPVGVSLADESYWSLCAHYSAQMRKLEQDVDVDVQQMHSDAIHWGKLREGRWCALSKSCRGLAKTLFDIMDWDQDLKYRFRGDFIENDDQKVMLFQLDEPEMVKTENIVLPPKEAETDDRAEIAGRTVKQIINILPPEWEDTFGRPITSIGEINLLEQRHYAADWDVLRPAKELAEYSTLTSEDLEELLHEAEKIIEGWPIPDEHGAGESADNGDGESAGVGTECGADVGAGTEENGDRADL